MSIDQLSPDCVHALMLQLDYESCTALRSTCAAFREATADDGFRCCWMEVHSQSFIRYRESARYKRELHKLTSHFSTLDEEALETEPDVRPVMAATEDRYGWKEASIQLRPTLQLPPLPPPRPPPKPPSRKLHRIDPESALIRARQLFDRLDQEELEIDSSP
mmetsp:Transcript_56679/g.123333  ORF Transcript_56679/g.123333 Transcript_56679/m.123333 type:complete len:162 (-) Transcript_56679:546-1031(-)